MTELATTPSRPEQTDHLSKKTSTPLLKSNLRAAKRIYRATPPPQMRQQLKTLTDDFGFSVARGELQIINGSWYVTHTGLLRLARRKQCRGIHVEAVDSLCDSAASRYVLKATVYPSKELIGFVGYGDADPTNVSALVRGAEMRIAETRAVNRALRKAYGIGICSVEEMGAYRCRPCLPLLRRCRPLQCQWQRQWFRPQSPRPALPDHPPAQARSRTGQGLCRRFLRHRSAQRRHPRAGRRFRPAPGRLGAEGPRRLAVPAQQLRADRRGGGGMKRHVPGLSATVAESRPALPDGLFLVRVESAQHRWHAQKPFYVLRFSVIEPRQFAGCAHHRPALLHSQGDVEAGLVPARFPLRPGTAEPGRDR